MSNRIIFLTLLVLTSWVNAAENDPKALAIMQLVDELDTGFESYTVNVEMILHEPDAASVYRKMRNWVLERENDGDMSVVVFDTPKDLAGVASLTHTQQFDLDEHWLYMPTIGRTKRIAKANQSGPFLGSEFAYEDLGSQETGKYQHQYLHEVTTDGDIYDVIERRPTLKYSGYAKQHVWVNREHHRIEKILFFDFKDQPLKTLEHQQFSQYRAKFWRPAKSFMRNHQTGRVTEVLWQDYDFQAELTAAQFSANALQRYR